MIGKTDDEQHVATLRQVHFKVSAQSSMNWSHPRFSADKETDKILIRTQGIEIRGLP